VGPGPKTPGCVDQLTLPSGGGPPLSRGGNTFGLLKTELRFPIADNVSLTTFVDLGNLWVDFGQRHVLTLRIGTGIGIRYNTPVGALAVDFGINPMPRAANFEASNQLHFSIGAF
jgi:outer membrane protein insertion porin family